MLVLNVADHHLSSYASLLLSLSNLLSSESYGSLVVAHTVVAQWLHDVDHVTHPVKPHSNLLQDFLLVEIYRISIPEKHSLWKEPQ